MRSNQLGCVFSSIVKASRNSATYRLVRFEFRAGFVVETAGGTPCPMGFSNGRLLGWVATGPVRTPVPVVVCGRFVP